MKLLQRSISLCLVLVGCILLLHGTTQTSSAFANILANWNTAYPGSNSSNINCQLCHMNASGGDGWNVYGWSIRQEIYDNGLTLTNAILSVEMLDADGNDVSNVDEINSDTQPGWTTGTNNTIYFKDGTTQGGETAPAQSNPDPSILTVIKIVDGDPMPVGTIFDVQVAGTTVLTAAGTYTEVIPADGATDVVIGEPAIPVDPAGGTWQFGASNCMGVTAIENNNDGTFTASLSSEIDAVCTFTNVYTAPEPPQESTLSIVKVVDGDPMPAGTMFDVQMDGATVLIAAGTYTQLITATETGVVIGEPAVPVDSAGGTWTVAGGCTNVTAIEANPDGDSLFTVGLSPNFDATCTFTNTYTAPPTTLTVINEVAGDPAPVGTLFDIQVDGTTVLTAAGTYTETIPIGGRTGVIIGEPAVPVTPSGTWQSSLLCGGVTAIDNTDTSTFTVDLSSSSDATCTFTNTYTAGDKFEVDDGCVDANMIGTDGVAQAHTFHDANDVDWLKFEGQADVTYQLLGLGGADSPVDLVVELFIECDGTIVEEQSHPFAPDVRLQFEVPTNGTYYVKLYNQSGSVYGEDMTYTVSIQEEGGESDLGVAVIVAGKQGDDDPLQGNIHNVTNRVYRLFADRDYPDSRIHYLATDPSLDPYKDGTVYVDDTPTLANLERIIMDNINQLGNGVPLTLYMMSHGLRDELYFDGANGAVITPDDLDALLTDVETAVPGVIINVIIDACYSGSFIANDDEFGKTLSSEGRVIVTSASDWRLAWASTHGSRFSDFFINALDLEYSVAEAFQIARSSTRAVRFNQNPQLDDNGNGTGNDLQDGAVASERGFSFDNFGVDNWVPYIKQIDAVSLSGGTAEFSIQVLDDKGNSGIEAVWAVLVPPSYIEPAADNTAESGDLILDQLPTITLTSTTGGYYTGTSPTLTELGEYEVIFYAQDKEDGLARPVSTTFTSGLTIPLNIGLSRLNTQTTLIVFLVICMFAGGLTMITFRR